MMHHKVIGVFDDRQKAARAREDLIVSGFAANEIDVLEQPSEGREDESLWTRIKDYFTPEESRVYREAARRGNIVLAVTADDARLDRAENILEQYKPVDIGRKVAEWRATGWKPTDEETIPLAEEELKVGKRTVRGGGVRIHTYVTERPVQEQLKLREEHVGIERHPVDRPAGEEAFQEKTIEAREMREEPVVSKEARVVEEVRVFTEAAEREETITERLRKTELVIEELDKDYRDDYAKHYAKTKLPYEDYQSAYRFGSRLAMDPQFEGRPWNQANDRAQLLWKEQNLGLWDRFKEAVRFGYERTLKERGKS